MYELGNTLTGFRNELVPITIVLEVDGVVPILHACHNRRFCGCHIFMAPLSFEVIPRSVPFPTLVFPALVDYNYFGSETSDSRRKAKMREVVAVFRLELMIKCRYVRVFEDRVCSIGIFYSMSEHQCPQWQDLHLNWIGLR